MIWKIILTLAAGLACLVAAALGVGALLPRDHVVSGERVIAASPEKLAALIGDPRTYEGWRKGAKISDVRAEDGAYFWRETAHGDAIDYRLTEEEAGRLWRSTILTQGLPYGGYWIIEVAPDPKGAKVRVTEHGFVDNLAFRTLGRFVFGLDSSLKAYLRDLNVAATPSV